MKLGGSTDVLPNKLFVLVRFNNKTDIPAIMLWIYSNPD